MAFSLARWIGPFGSAEGRLATVSRELTQKNPRAFVAPTLLWVFVNACLAAKLVASALDIQHPHSPLPGYDAGFYSVMVLVLMAMGIIQWIGLGWIIRWRLARLRRRDVTLSPEPAVYTLTPGIWAALTAAHGVAALLLLLQIMNLHMAGIVFARHVVLIGVVIVFVAVVQALAAYYRQPFLVLWRTIAFPVVVLIIAFLGAIAMVSFHRYQDQLRAQALAREGLGSRISQPNSYQVGPAATMPPVRSTAL
ncbi:MAG: hypothetical protein ACYDEV_14170 [Acidiferrobacter sp.]